MAKNENKMSLVDLVGLDFLQKLQDSFSEVTGIPSLTYGKTEPITKPSNFVEICSEFIRKSKTGSKRCQECDLKWAKLAAKKNEPIIYKCHAGITDFVIPIIVGGQHIASIYGGQILTEKPNEDAFRKYAREIEVDEDGYIKALRKIKIIPKEKVEAAVKFLSIVSNTISKIAHKNLELREKREREQLYQNIAESIRVSLNVNEIKDKMVNLIGKTLDADRCFFMEYDKETDKFLIVEHEYISSAKVTKYAGADVNIDVPNFISEFKKGHNLLIDNKKVFIDGKSQNYDSEKATIERVEVISAYGVPLIYDNNLHGVLGIHYLSNEHVVSEDEINLLKVIIEQLSVAFYQAELYEKTKVQAERESLLRGITDKIRSSLNFKETLSFITQETAKAIDVQRAVLVWYPNPNMPSVGDIKEEYKDHNIIQSIQEQENFQQIALFWTSNIMNNKKIIAYDDVENSDIPENIKMTYKDMGVKSIIGVPIINEDNVCGNLFLSEYRKIRHWSEEEKNLLELISSQIYIAINQSELFENEKRIAKREELLREVVGAIRSSINIDETLTIICDNVANLFKVDRATIIEFFDKTDFSKWKIRREYKRKEDILGLTDFTFDPRAGVYNGEIIMNQGNNLVINNMDKADVPDYYKETYRQMGVKSALSVPIKSGEDKFGIIYLSSIENYREWSNDDIELLEDIASQVYIAITQAELFEKEKTDVARQKLIANIFSKALSTLDIGQLKPIVSKIGNILKADRCYFVEVDLEKMGGKPIEPDWEYLSSSDIKSVIGYNFEPEDVKKFVEIYLSEQDVKVFDYEEILADNQASYSGIIKYIKRFDLKSGIGVPFFYMNKLTAVLCIEYVKEKVLPSDDEMEFLQILGNQVGLAYNQIKNYQHNKETAEREIVLRKVIEAVRSSLDIKEVKKNIVNQLGKIFHADRCYFRSYDTKNDKILPPDVEYLASDSIQSLMKVEPDQYALKYFVDAVKKENRRFYPIVVDWKFAEGTPMESYFISTGIKADYAIPIVDRHDELTWLVLHYTNEDPKFDETYKKLLETIAYQIDIAFEQIRLYNNTQRVAKRESLLRNIYETMRSSLDSNMIKNTIVTGVGSALNADLCFISSYNPEGDYFYIDEYSQYRSSDDLYSFVDHNSLDDRLKGFAQIFKNKTELSYYDLNIFIQEYNLSGTPEEEFLVNLKNKSGYGFQIKYANKILGFLSLLYINEDKRLDYEDLEFMKKISTQAGIAIYQADLYKVMQLQAEREKISKNIIEILRSSLDKNVIKHLFVKNIGKYFNADRVCFFDYDSNQRIFLPVESDSEYLSSPDVKSFVGYDMTGEDTREYVQPLLEKRELNIFCWDEYIQKNVKGAEFIELFQKFDVKSSYNLPVLYQGEIMGYFCIEFTQSNCQRLSDEDINRIRNMCTQAGIALYHANLYVKAQESARILSEFIAKTAQGCISSLTEIQEIAKSLLDEETKREEQLDKIKNIKELSKQILEKVMKCKENMDSHY